MPRLAPICVTPRAALSFRIHAWVGLVSSSSALPAANKPSLKALRQPMMPNLRVETGGERLDRFLAHHFPEHSRSYLQKLVEQGRVRVEGAPQKAGYLTKLGQLVELTDFTQEELLPQAKARALPIIYEDADLLVVDKPAGLTVHPVRQGEEGTLVHALLSHNPEIRKAVHDPE